MRSKVHYASRYKLVSIAIFGIFILILVARGILSSNFKYEIREPDRSASSVSNGSVSHFCNNYTEEGDCIIFVDEFGAKNKICGTYKIIKN